MCACPWSLPGAAPPLNDMASEYLKWKYRDVKPDEPPPPLTGWPKIKNWLHYNWHWIVIPAVVAAVAVSMLLNALGVGKVKPDYIFAYVAKRELSETDEAALVAAVEKLGEDTNGDGHVHVELRPYVTPDMSDAEAYQYGLAVSVRLMGDISSGESVFFLTDDPESLQLEYQVLAMPDGSAPAEEDYSWEGKAIPVGDCQLGLDADSGLYIGRRYFVDKAPDEADEALWRAITTGAAK